MIVQSTNATDVAQRLDVVNAALSKIGDNRRITDFDGTDTKSLAINASYQRIYETMLSSFDWNFCRAQADLPETDYTAAAYPSAASLIEANHLYQWAYLLPSDFISLIRIYPRHVDGEFLKAVKADNSTANMFVCSQKGGISINYISYVGEVHLPGYAQSLLVLMLAEDFILSIANQEEKLSGFSSMRLEAELKAQNIESQGRPSREFDDNDLLINARR